MVYYNKTPCQGVGLELEMLGQLFHLLKSLHDQFFHLLTKILIRMFMIKQ